MKAWRKLFAGPMQTIYADQIFGLENRENVASILMMTFAYCSTFY
jgi:hypothetical protein